MTNHSGVILLCSVPNSYNMQIDMGFISFGFCSTDMHSSLLTEAFSSGKSFQGEEKPIQIKVGL